MFNRVVLIGRLTRDPIQRRTTTDTAVTSFTLAVDDRFSKEDDKKSTMFIDVTVFNTQAENVGKMLRKGSLVAVDGRLRQRSYERRDGSKATVIEVVADSVRFLEPKDARGNEQVEPDYVEESAPVDGDHLDSMDIADDDLPFQKGREQCLTRK